MYMVWHDNKAVNNDSLLFYKVVHACDDNILVFIRLQQVLPFKVGGSEEMGILRDKPSHSVEDTRLAWFRLLVAGLQASASYQQLRKLCNCHPFYRQFINVTPVQLRLRFLCQRLICLQFYHLVVPPDFLALSRQSFFLH